MSLYRRWKKRRYCDGCLQTSQLRHLDIASHLRRLETVVAIAMLWAIVSQLRRLPPNTFLSVDIATLFYKCRYSNGFGRDGKNLGKFPTFGQKRQNQVSEFPPNVVVGTSGYGLWDRQLDEVKLCGFMDAHWAGSPMDRKSRSGGIFSIGSTAVSWYSRKQRSMAFSSAEAEYMVASLAACEAIWMRKILVGLFSSHLDPTVIYCDNQICIKLLVNLVFHDRSKHIDIRYHHIRDCVQQKIMLLIHSYGGSGC